MMKGLHHPNVVKLYQFIDAECIYIAMEYVESDTLHIYLRNHRPLSEEKIRSYFQQTISAFYYLHHEKNTVHW